MNGTKLRIKECGVKECSKTGRWHNHRPNPRGQAMKGIEMTVRRAITLIEAFDQLIEDGGEDWTDLSVKAWRYVFGTVNPSGRELPELWERYKASTLHQQTIDLADNLNMEDLSKESRKEIKDGIAKIRKGLNR